MVGRVSTFVLSGRLNNQNLNLQTELAKTQIQISSGKIGQSYAATGRATQRLLNTQNDLARIESQNVVSENIQSRINTMFSTVNNIQDLASNFLSKLSQSLGGNLLVPADIVNTASNGQQALQSLLNINLGGRYLFAGDAIDTLPVDLADPAYAIQTSPSTVDTAYYQGDGVIASAEISDAFDISYGVTANDPAFEQLFRAMNLAANNPTDLNALNEAFDLVNSAVDSLGQVQTNLTAKANVIDGQIAKNEEDANLFRSIISSISDTDLAAATINLTNLQTQLEASYSNVGRISRLKLFNFL